MLKREVGKILMVEKRTYTGNGGFKFKMITVDMEDKVVVLERGGFGWSEIDPKTGTFTGMDWVRVVAEGGPVSDSTIKRIRMIETPEEFDAIYDLLYEQFKHKR